MRKNQFESVREAHASEKAQDYVEAISEIIAERGECRLVDIARRFAVTHVTANRTVARLKRDGYATSEPYGPIELTDDGKRLAEFSHKRHRIVAEFLLSIGVPESVAENDAEGIEHHVSPETLRAMAKFTKRKQD
ncbi:MAG: manganese-binding transcriptional regulator MntR [Pirellula sp.]|jgi:DtxR family manganese transport transcriptional regulator|nr:manganese-binding transcriptional regulator MntR [Pirellula sp.]